MAHVALRHFAQAVDFGTPGRVSALDFVDSKDSVFAVVSVEVLAERHDDSGDFLAGVVADVNHRDGVVGGRLGASLVDASDERANLVYAIKVEVQNDGLIKRGMYGDLRFTE